jgi:transcriptional regulator with XRE-family HTH domain
MELRAFAKLNETFSMLEEDSRARAVQDQLAANLRRLRIARHLSLSELARATGMSKATLSGIENGRANPTVETLASLAAALRVSIVELLEEPPLGEVRVVRAAGATPARRDGVARRALEAVGADGSLELHEIALDARHLHEEAAKPAGTRASVYVLDGTLIAGPVERSTELGAGDYIAFPADVAHVYETGRHAARALLLTRSPS